MKRYRQQDAYLQLIREVTTPFPSLSGYLLSAEIQHINK